MTRKKPITKQAKRATIPVLDEEFIRENACQQPGCRNWSSGGYIYCVIHLHGSPRQMDAATAKRKLALEKK